MNRLLVRTLDFLNGFIAFIIIVVAATLGIAMGPLYAFLLTVCGIVAAALVCGLVAYLSLIERHLETIAASTSQGAANLRFLTKSAALQNAVAEMEIAAHEERERRQRAA